MAYLLIHGLGQGSESWKDVCQVLSEEGIETECLDLFKLESTGKQYSALFQAFANQCNSYEDKVDLCGLSLGGLLALDYAKAYPQKVNSLIVIGTPYEIPKRLFQLQSCLFHLMPQSTFTKMGSTKQDFLALVKSMAHLAIADGLENIKCPVLILCGEKDRANQKSAIKMHEYLKQSKYQQIQAAAHEVNKENPLELAKAMVDFWC